MVGGGIDPRAAVAEALYVLQWADVRKRTAASQVGVARRVAAHWTRAELKMRIESGSTARGGRGGR